MKKEIDEYIEREESQGDYFFDKLHMCNEPKAFMNGANLLVPLLVEAIKCLEVYAKLPESVKLPTVGQHTSPVNWPARNTLKSIKQKLGVKDE